MTDTGAGITGSAPRVSAVVTAHDRREFLSEAVRSAIDAGADEVLVVRNFGGPITGSEGRYRDVYCADTETNAKESMGLELSTGEVVAFLDDDDLWDPTKVARVRDWFARDPALVYACHDQQSVDADGRPVTAEHREYSARDPSRFASWDGEDLGRLVREAWPGNNSSTVVRRSWGLSVLPAFRRAGWGADLFWLSIAVLHRERIFLSPERLTRLRLHGENMSHSRGATPEGFRARHAVSCERFARSLDVLRAEAAERRGVGASVTRFLDETAVGYRFLADLETGRRPRTSALHALRAGPGLRDRGVTLAAWMTLASPALARRALYRSSLRRWNLRPSAPQNSTP